MSQPLPKGSFTFRRIFTFVVTTALLALLAWVVWRIDDVDRLTQVALALILLIWWFAAFYMIAPSAEHIARIVQSAKLALFDRGKGE